MPMVVPTWLNQRRAGWRAVFRIQGREMATAKAGVALIREWEQTEQVRAFLLRLTGDDLEAISRVAIKDGHPMQEKALALLRAVYDPA